MINFHQLNPKIYLSGAIVIGFFQVIDGLAALFESSNNMAGAFSLIEIFWLFVSLLFFIAFKKQRLKLLIPNLFIAYSLYGWVVGSYLLSTKLPDEALVLPSWFIFSATIFGFIYCASSAYFYWQWYIIKKSTLKKSTLKKGA